MRSFDTMIHIPNFQPSNLNLESLLPSIIYIPYIYNMYICMYMYMCVRMYVYVDMPNTGPSFAPMLIAPHNKKRIRAQSGMALGFRLEHVQYQLPRCGHLGFSQAALVIAWPKLLRDSQPVSVNVRFL